MSGRSRSTNFATFLLRTRTKLISENFISGHVGFSRVRDLGCMEKEQYPSPSGLWADLADTKKSTISEYFLGGPCGHA